MNNSTTRTLLRGVNVAFFVGTAVWVCLVLAAAYRLSKLTGGATTSAVFGPLTLTQISTEMISQGRTTVSFSLEYGLLFYVMFWILAGIGIGLLWCQRNRL